MTPTKLFKFIELQYPITGDGNIPAAQKKKKKLQYSNDFIWTSLRLSQYLLSALIKSICSSFQVLLGTNLQSSIFKIFRLVMSRHPHIYKHASASLNSSGLTTKSPCPGSGHSPTRSFHEHTSTPWLLSNIRLFHNDREWGYTPRYATP
eukprot:sb/3473625/